MAVQQHGVRDAGHPPHRRKASWAGSTSACPSDEFIESQLTGYFAPKNFNYLVLLRLHRARGAGAAAGHRHLPHDVLQAGRGDLLRLGRVHHAGGRFRLAHPLHAFHGCVGVLRRRLPAHVPRVPVRLVQGPAGAAVAGRHARLPRADGGGVHGLRAALGQHVVLGRAGDRQHLRHHSGDRTGAGRVDPRRLRHRRCHVEPLLRAARRGGPARSCWRSSGCTCRSAAHGLEQSRTASRSRRRWDPMGTRWTAFRSIPTTR